MGFVLEKIFVNGLSALDLIHKVDKIPINASKYKAIESIISVGGAARSSIAIQRLGGQAYLSSVIGKDKIGQIIRKRISEAIFKKIFFSCLIMLGIFITYNSI